MVMNNVGNLVTDPITGQPVNQQMRQPNAAVYNNSNAMATGQAVFGDPMARQNSVSMVNDPQPAVNLGVTQSVDTAAAAKATAQQVDQITGLPFQPTVPNQNSQIA
jgi:hypothetical protein